MGDNEEMDEELFRQAVFEHAKFLGMDPDVDGKYMWIAEEALTAPLPENWEQGVSDDGMPYHFNTVTGESIWEHPRDQEFKEMFERMKAQDARAENHQPALADAPPQEQQQSIPTQDTAPVTSFDEVEELDVEQLDDDDEVQQPPKTKTVTFDQKQHVGKQQQSTTNRGNANSRQQQSKTVAFNDQVTSFESTDDQWMDDIVDEMEGRHEPGLTEPMNTNPPPPPEFDDNPRNVQDQQRGYVPNYDDRGKLNGSSSRDNNPEPHLTQHNRQQTSHSQHRTGDDDQVFQLKKQVEELTIKLGDADHESARLQNELRTKNEAMTQLREQAQKSQDMTDTLNSVITKLKGQLADKENDLSINQDAVQRLEAKLNGGDALKRDILEYEETTRTLQRKQSELMKELTEANDKAGQLMREKSDLVNQLHQSDATSAQLQRTVTEHESKTGILVREKENLKNELTASRELLETANERLKTTLAEVSDKATQIQQLQQEVCTLEQQIQVHDEVGPKEADSRLLLETYKSDQTKAEALAKAYENRLKAVLQEKENLLKQLQKQRMDFKERIASLESSNRRMDSDLHLLTQEQEDRIHEAEDERSQAIMKLRDVEKQLLKAESVSRREASRADRTELKLNEVQQRLDDMQSHLEAHAETGESRVSLLEDERSEMHDKLSTKSKQILELETQVNRLMDQHAKELLKVRTSSSEDVRAAMEEAARRAAEEWKRRGAEKLEQVATELAHLRTSTDTEKQALQERLTHATDELEKLRHNVHKEEGIVSELSAELIKLQAANSTLVSLLEETRMQLFQQHQNGTIAGAAVAGPHSVNYGQQPQDPHTTNAIRALEAQINELREQCRAVLDLDAARGRNEPERVVVQNNMGAEEGSVDRISLANLSHEESKLDGFVSHREKGGPGSSAFDDEHARVSPPPMNKRTARSSAHSPSLDLMMMPSMSASFQQYSSPNVKQFMRTATRLYSASQSVGGSQSSRHQQSRVRFADEDGFSAKKLFFPSRDMTLAELGAEQPSSYVSASQAGDGSSGLDSPWYKRNYWRSRYGS